MDLPAFSRAIERRGSAVNDHFPALQAKTCRAGHCDRSHCEDPGCRGPELRAVLVTRDLGDRRRRVAWKIVAKIGSTKKSLHSSATEAGTALSAVHNMSQTD